MSNRQPNRSELTAGRYLDKLLTRLEAREAARMRKEDSRKRRHARRTAPLSFTVGGRMPGGPEASPFDDTHRSDLAARLVAAGCDPSLIMFDPPRWLADDGKWLLSARGWVVSVRGQPAESQ